MQCLESLLSEDARCRRFRSGHATTCSNEQAVFPVTSLALLEAIDADQPSVVDEERQHFAVHCFDRAGARHINCEDSAQILGVKPLQTFDHPLVR